MEQPQAIFGTPSVWDSTFKEYGKVFRSIESLRTTARELVAATKDSEQELVQVLNALTQICSESMFDVLILAGNRRGFGAMKIARGMFEISVLSEYLVRNPNEIEDYLNFGIVESWRHLQAVERYSPGRVPTELMREAGAGYDRVTSQFSNARGRVRSRWVDKTIKQMAEEVGRLNIYEIAYGLASELHHMPVTGIIGHELDWLREALFVAQGSLLATVAALYNAHRAGSDFRSKIDAAIVEFESCRKQPGRDD